MTAKFVHENTTNVYDSPVLLQSSKFTYRKLPLISPGLIQLRKGVLGGLINGGLISGGGGAEGS